MLVEAAFLLRLYVRYYAGSPLQKRLTLATMFTL